VVARFMRSCGPRCSRPGRQVPRPCRRPCSAGLPPRVSATLDGPLRRPAAAQVNYVAKAVNLYADAGYQLGGSAYVIEK
jgi:hypothetical protein